MLVAFIYAGRPLARSACAAGSHSALGAAVSLQPAPNYQLVELDPKHRGWWI